MECPFCHKDYKDVRRGMPPGGFLRGDPHFYEKTRRIGMICMNCGKVGEFITAPTGKEFRIRENDDTKSQADRTNKK